MIRLIVNADDLGSGAPTDRAIFRAFTHGIVTSASLLVTGPSCTGAAAEARRLGLPLGVHLNLTEGRALAGPIAGLTDAAGAFPGKAAGRARLLAGAAAPADLERELAAQLQRALDCGLAPDHVDSHQHVALLPAVTPVVLRVMAAFGLRRLRLPLPADAADAAVPAPLAADLDLYRRLAPALRQAVAAANLVTPDGLWGMPLLNRLDTPALLALLAQLPEGTWELMVHPGALDPDNPFSGPERLREGCALCHPEVAEQVRARGIHLITFGALP